MTTPEGLSGSDGAGVSAASMTHMVTAKDLQRAVADLQLTKPGPGLRKVLLCYALLAFGTYSAMTAQSTSAFVLAGIFSGLVLSVMIITTHDAIHHTLTGWGWFDEIVPRLISWPILWFHGVYSEVHKIHHKMNGDDFNDPERVQWTAEEYERASPLGKFYVRHQWLLDIFVLGGIALIVNTLRSGLRFVKVSKSMRVAVLSDLIGIVTCNVVIYAIAYSQGAMLRWFLFWLMLERCTGAVMQWRSHIEHYGLWGKGRHYFETQAYSCRNIATNGFTSWFFNRLNFHSVHHAFPRVPFYLLETAHRRFMELYGVDGVEHLVEERGYVATSLRLAANPCVIGAPDEQSPSKRRRMVAIGN